MLLPGALNPRLLNSFVPIPLYVSWKYIDKYDYYCKPKTGNQLIGRDVMSCPASILHFNREMSMNKLHSFASVSIIVFGLVLPPAHAARLSTALQVELQTAMLSYNDSILSEGEYRYLDTRTDTMRVIYPANAHPFVVMLGDNYFVCSEFIDENGYSITADYLVIPIKGQYTVVQMIIDDRESLVHAMKKAGR